MPKKEKETERKTRIGGNEKQVTKSETRKMKRGVREAKDKKGNIT